MVDDEKTVKNEIENNCGRVQLNFESKTEPLLLQSPEPPGIFPEPPGSGSDSVLHSLIQLSTEF